MKKGRIVRWGLLMIIFVMAIFFVINNFDEKMFASGGDERIVFAYGKAMVASQNIGIVVDEEKATILEITSPSQEVTQLPAHDDINYEVKANGVYTFRLLDQNGGEIAKVEKRFDDLDEFNIIETEINWQLISRNPQIVQAQVTCGDFDQAIALEADDSGILIGSLPLPSVTTCQITPQYADGTAAKDVIEYTSKNTEEADKEQQVPLKRQLASKEDFNLIKEYPDGIFELTNDIDMDRMQTLNVIFSGTIEGNGYQLYNVEQSLFTKMEDATIQKLHVQGDIKSAYDVAGYALQAKNVTITGSSYQGAISSEKKVAGFFVNANNTTIENSYVSAKLTGLSAAGFVLDGESEIFESYVTGVLEAEETAYGFGKSTSINDSYIAANLSGINQWMFNADDASLTDSFYDASLNDFEETRASAYRNHEMISKDLNVGEAFMVEEGFYPQIKEEVSKEWSERTQKSAELSVFSMPLESHENMATLVEPLTLPETIKDEKITWSSDGDLSVQSEVVEEQDEKPSESTIIEATNENGTRYFAMRGAQLLASNDIVVGERAASPTTTISFNATDGYYYKVAKKAEVVNDVKTHKDAIDAGFKKRIGTGIYNVAGLEWNTDYKVYETDLTTMSVREAKTNYGLLGGTLSVTGTTKVGETLTATLQDTTTSDGTWSWYYAQDMQSTWTLISGETSNTLVLKPEYLGKYIKTIFTSNKATNIDGSAEYIQDMTVKQELNASESITIIGNAEIGAKLNVTFSAGLSESNFNIQWYHKSSSGQDVKIGGGSQHDIIADDIGKQLYAVATTKAESNYIGELTSDLTNPIIALKTTAPTVGPQMVAGTLEDTTVVMKMPDTIKDGLYRFGYRVAGETDYTEFPITVRANNKLTITGLTPKQTYQFVVKRIGENGYLDSDWGTRRTSVSMGNQYITGYLELTGQAIFGETLESKFITEDFAQKVNTNWYRLKDGVREPNPIGTGDRYTIKAEDVGCKIEAEASGYDTYGGFVRVRSETVVKAFVNSPTGVVTETGTAEANAISVRLPSLDSGMSSAEDKFIIGISDSANGYPLKYAVNGTTQEYTQNEVVKLEGLKPQTKYYIYVAYAATASHYQSDWSLYKATVQTIKETFVGTISFGYQTNMDAIQGEKISARVTTTNPNFAYEGTWEWKRINPDNSEAIISNFYPEKDGDGNELKNETYFIIPEGEVVGTKYRATYIPDARYTGTATAISNAVKEPLKEAYDAPSKPDEVSHTDNVITVKMPSSLEGVYAFSYGTMADGSDRVELSTTALAGAQVVIDGLNRNTTYYVFAKRVKDVDKNESPWSTTGLSVKTELTNISGNITLEENASYGTKLTAVYNPSSYTPTGDDSKGTWQWYRGTTTISGATTNEYTPVQSDIGATLKVVYTAKGSDGFQGSKEASTKAVNKAVPTNPTKVQVNGIEYLGKSAIQATFHPLENVYYRLQKASDAAPVVPLNSSEATKAKWTMSPKTTTSLAAEYDGTLLSANLDYVLYVVKIETTTEQASSVVASDAMKPSVMGVTGTVAISGDAVVGKALTATLKSSNNTTGRGTWKWYRSTQSYPTITSMPSVTDTSKWTQIASGYAPTKDSLTSTYNITNADFGYYMKAEFVSDETQGYRGSIQTGNAYNKRIFEEALSIEGKGYPGEKITIKLDGSRTVGELTTKKVRIMNGSTKIAEYEGTRVDDKTFTVTIPNNTTTQGYPDGYTVLGAVNVPDARVYVKPDGSSITETETLTNTLNFKGGIPITNASDLKAFLEGTGTFTSRTIKYTLTNDINMSGIAYTPSTSIFSGILDGDYHQIIGLNNILFTTGMNSTIMNLIINSQNVDTSSVTDITSSASSIMQNSSGGNTFKRVFLSQVSVKSGWDAGYFIGRVSSNALSGDKFYECASAGGSLDTASVGTTISGLVGFVHEARLTVENVSSLNVTLGSKSSNPYLSGFVTGYQSTEINMKNIVSTSRISADNNRTSSILYEMATVKKLSMTNTFYDTTFAPGSNLNGTRKGTGKITQELIGDKLRTSFNADDIWTYSDGYYPRLTWLVDNDVENMFAITRGAFISLDGKTNSTDLFNGQVKGSIQIPSDLQKDVFTISSSAPTILKVGSNGVITPLKSGSATITLTYKNPNTGGTATNTFDFTSSVSMSSYDSVTLSGTPNVGVSYASSVLPSAAASGSSYQWYRKKVDSANSTATAISGATTAGYTPVAGDIGYQLQVKVSKSGYGTSVSNWSNPVVISAPTSAPAISSITDNGFVITGKGSLSTAYEYAYSETTSGEKILFDAKGASATITGMQRNKDYYIFSRIAGGTGYNASGWSPNVKVTTLKTDIEGKLTVTSTYNAGTNLIVSAPDTNLQTGTWKLEKTNDGVSYTNITSSTTNTTYGMTYPMKAADVGYYFRITYTGSGNFQNSISIPKSETVKNQLQSAPVEPTVVTQTDSSIGVKVASPESGMTYSFGYRSSLSDAITSITTSGSSTTITGLSRNTEYYLYARKNAKSGYEASDWSPATIQRTNRTALSGSITQSGTEQTESTLTFVAPGSKGETGRWKLERFNATQMTTLDDFSVSSDGRTLTYTLVPRDAQNKIRATFEGTGDFSGTTIKESGTIQNKGQSVPANNLTIMSSGEYYIEVRMDQGDDMYQFGYRKKGTSGAINVYEATTGISKTLRIDGLERNTEYELYARRAAKVGYDAGAWSTTTTTTTTTTTRSPLNGNISFTGSAIVGQNVTATFNSSGYPQPGDDTKGTWKWYLDGTEITGNGKSITVPTVEKGNPELKVIYTANEADGFEGSVSRVIGNITKTAFNAPNVPTVKALVEDNTKGSKVQVTNTAVDDVYYYMQSSDLNSVPDLIIAKEVTATTPVEGQWVKATTNMTFNLDPNKGYQLFAARLETDTRGVSGIVTGQSVRTVKEELNVPIKDQDESIVWKANQEKVLYYTLYDGAPTGTWSFFITKDLASDWQNVDAQLYDVEQGVNGKQAYVKFTLPLKFTDYYVKAVFTGAQDFTGSKEYISRSPEDSSQESVLIGQTMKGYVEILNPDTNELLVPINVQYVGDDEKSGIWKWYRETAEGSDVFEEIAGAGNVGVTSTYTPNADDFNRNIYAVYQANPKGLYSGEQQSGYVKQEQRSKQNKPNKVQIKEVNGTRILVGPPSNYNSDPDGTLPQVILGYKEAKDKDNADAPITWQLESQYGSNWFNNFKINTGYVFYARFAGTPTYDISEISDASDVATTKNENFIQSSYKLKRNLDVADSYIMDVGNSLTVTYSDSGWDEGYFVIKRSNGDVIESNLTPTYGANSASCDYTYQTADIGTHIIVEYVAKADAQYHSGSIVTATSEPVTKPIDQSVPNTPILTAGETTLTLDSNNAKYDYALTTSPTAPDKTSGDWNKLPVADGASYEFSDVKRQNQYYLHVRIAETVTVDAGDKSVTVGPVKVTGPIDLGTMTLANVEDSTSIPTGKTNAIELPNIITGSTLTIKNMKLEKNGVAVTNPQTSVDEFVNGGQPHENVFTKGSDWGDQNFASDLQVVDADGNVLSSSHGDGTTLNNITTASMIQLQMYRVNAVKESGTYVWTCDLEDELGNVASYQAEVKVDTQIKAMVPIKIDMFVRDGYIHQTSNTEVLTNDGMMPINYQMDELAEAGVNMPNLLGTFNKTPETIGRGEVFLKISSDGTNFTKPNGIWMRTNGTSASQSLVSLGAQSKAGYLVSGISDKTMNWPWASADDRFIAQAYKFHFIIDVSNSDIDRNQSVIRP